MYRIISGKLRGKKIAAPKNFDVRPTTDFAKEALFSIIGHRKDVEHLSVLDLFAGIGSITLEFASRDVQDITAIEGNVKHAAFIDKTAKELDLGLQVNVVRSDVFEWLKKGRNHAKKFDLIFADPPFNLGEHRYIELVNLIMDAGILNDGGLLIVEHPARQPIDHPLAQETRKYGNLSFSFFETGSNTEEQ